MIKKEKQEEKINISKTEDELMQDPNGIYKDQLTKKLYNEAYELKKIIDAGSTPNEYDKNVNLMLSLLASIDVIKKTWKKHHSTT